MVTPTAAYPPGDISLSDGTSTVYLKLANSQGQPDARALRAMGMPRTSLQMTQGDPDYGSFVLPYIPVVQKDWSGGRGLEDWTKDTTRYYDSYQMDTRAAEGVILGPKATPTRTQYSTGEATSYYTLLPTEGMATAYTPTVSFALKSIVTSIYVSTYAVGDNTITVKLYSDTSSHPNVLLATSNAVRLYAEGAADVEFLISYSLVAGTKYWIEILAGADIGSGAATATGAGIVHSDSPYTVISATKTWALALRAFSSGESILFEYKGTLFAVTKPDDFSAPKIFQNGLRGMVTTPNTGVLNITYTGLTLASSLAGKIIKIVAGPGSEEETPWRVIAGNLTTANADIYVSPPWNVVHSTATEFVILGRDAWPEITGHGLTKPVTDVLVVDDIVYFCQGDATNIRRGRLKSDATWDTWADDGTNKATFMDLIPDTTGKRKVWAAQATTSNIYSCDVVAWGTNLTFGTAIVCGNPKSRITNLIAYGQPQIPHVLKEDSFGSVSSGIYAQVPLSEIQYARSENNGRAACQFGVYLFFSLLDGLERYYDNRLDDIGPNRDEGFPTTRQGPVYGLIPYPGGIIASVDGGDSGYSCIMYWNQLGWHELYRGDKGIRFKNLYVQVIPGSTVDRLWFSAEEDIYYIPICMNPRKQADYSYRISAVDPGYLITSWYKTQFAEVTKFWKSITLFTDNLLTTHQYLTVSYQTDTEDDDDTWHLVGTNVTTSPIQELLLSSTNNVTGKRIRFKIAFYSDSATISPRLKAITINAVCRVPMKKSWSLTFMAESAMTDRNGKPQAMTLDQLTAKLAEWADSSQRAAPLTMRSLLSVVDGTAGQTVFIDPPNVNPIAVEEKQGGGRKIKLIGNMAVYEA
jgi:hypothetical protein